MLLTSAAPLTAGTVVTYKGVRGVIKGSHEMAELMYEIALDDGRPGRAILKRSEFEAAHALSWSCTCAACVTARRTLGRAMVGA